MYVTFRFEEQIFALPVLAHWHNVSFLLIAIIRENKRESNQVTFGFHSWHPWRLKLHEEAPPDASSSCVTALCGLESGLADMLPPAVTQRALTGPQHTCAAFYKPPQIQLNLVIRVSVASAQGRDKVLLSFVTAVSGASCVCVNNCRHGVRFWSLCQCERERCVQ